MELVDRRVARHGHRRKRTLTASQAAWYRVRLRRVAGDDRSVLGAASADVSVAELGLAGFDWIFAAKLRYETRPLGLGSRKLEEKASLHLGDSARPQPRRARD